MLSTNPALLESPDFILPAIYPTSTLSQLYILHWVSAWKVHLISPSQTFRSTRI